MTEVEFAIMPNQRLNYVGLFELEKDKEFSMSGQRARVVLSASGLPTEQLASIWTLADRDQDGELSEEEFLIAYHLVVLASKGVPIPTTCPPELVLSASSAAPATLFLGRCPLPILPSPSWGPLRPYFAPLVAAPEVGQQWRYLLLFIILTLILFLPEWFVLCPSWLALGNLLGLGHLAMFLAVMRPRVRGFVLVYLGYVAIDIVLHWAIAISALVLAGSGRASCKGASVAGIVVLEFVLVLPILCIDFLLAAQLARNLAASGFGGPRFANWHRPPAPSQDVPVSPGRDSAGYGAIDPSASGAGRL
eukprot:TRINITY_DN15293_c0_g1_i1.p1 TRINITY_DN15293_c0_g1~~TRINITY_DN15293_c0_g1_i1.p1  ORF type:complete len:306 (+),score=60.51 TRINITY_DN15293_c0_g1_i1:170-1087(+)